MWESCALALDGSIYFMPSNANRIMKLDPNHDDAMSSVGDNLMGDGGYEYTVVGIPYNTCLIVKYDPINDVYILSCRGR